LFEEFCTPRRRFKYKRGFAFKSTSAKLLVPSPSSHRDVIKQVSKISTEMGKVRPKTVVTEQVAKVCREVELLILLVGQMRTPDDCERIQEAWRATNV
jgi:hypothetical protein